MYMIIIIIIKLTPQCSMGFSSPESTFSAYSLAVFVQPQCALIQLNICTHYLNTPKMASIHTQTLHTLVRMGRTTLAAAVPYPTEKQLFKKIYIKIHIM